VVSALEWAEIRTLAKDGVSHARHRRRHLPSLTLRERCPAELHAEPAGRGEMCSPHGESRAAGVAVARAVDPGAGSGTMFSPADGPRR
jgi:hypothetical protein